MWNRITNLFKTKNQLIGKQPVSIKTVDFIQISDNWNADPVNPQVEFEIDNYDLILDIYTKYVEQSKVKIRFKNCAEYSLNTCNDEGYFYGQYRVSNNRLPWGEFYEILSGLNRDYPEPIVKISVDKNAKRHFIFFFKDETFECLAEDYNLKFYSEN